MESSFASTGRNSPKRNTVHLQGNMVGQTISFCRLPGPGRDRPRKAKVCPTKLTVSPQNQLPEVSQSFEAVRAGAWARIARIMLDGRRPAP